VRPGQEKEGYRHGRGRREGGGGGDALTPVMKEPVITMRKRGCPRPERAEHLLSPRGGGKRG